ncbi:hypothetical protein DPL39_17445 [Escherichia coli]|nr:hypothetical protein [Escherichia coli]
MARALQFAQQAPLPGRVPENRQSGLVLYAGGDTFNSALPGCRLQLIAPREHRICTGRELHAQKTTRRWFHDTAYCFDYSDVSHGTRSGT